MASASPELLWQLIKNHNAGLIKVNKYDRPFSREAFNLRNVHTSRDSGYIRRKAVDIQAAKNGKGVVLSVKKTQASKQHTPATGATTVAVSAPFRAGAATVAAATGTVRKDLVNIAKGRFSRIKRSQTQPGVQKRKYSRRRHSKVRRNPNVVGL